jgi:hypothetical protein
MGLLISTNVMSLDVQRCLGQSQGAMQLDLKFQIV